MLISASPGPSTSTTTKLEKLLRFWSGEIEWKRPNRPPGNTIALLNCTLLASKRVVTNLKVKAWPRTLQLHLVPKQAFDKIGLVRYMRTRRGLVFALRKSIVREELTIAFEKGMIGCIKLSPPPDCDIKMIVLFYDRTNKVFFGVLPEHQDVVISKLHNFIENQIKQISKE